MIFKKYRDILQYIESVITLDPTLEKEKKFIQFALENRFKFKELQFIQEVDYSIDIYGKCKPILGEMKDLKTFAVDSFGRKICNHVVTFLVRELPDGTFITPDNIVFKLEVVPAAKNVYQTVKVTELIEVKNWNDVSYI